MTFRELQLQDILDVQWGDTKTTKSSYVPTGYLAYSASGPDGFLDRFDYDREGIVLSAIGANCGTTFFATGKWSCIKNTIRIFPKSESIDLKYFYYMTKAPDFWPIRGSAQSFISQTDIRELYVQLPELGIQRFIGNLLYELEQKINVNKAVSSTLQEITQALFKSWFIDFDPVKAKMAGERCEGLDEVTASLFPDSIEESELGLAPTGWTFSPLGSHISVTKGKSYKSSELSDSDTALVTLKSFMRGGGYRFDGLKAFSGSYKPEQVIEPGELVVSFTDVTQAADVIGKPAIVLGNPKYSTLVASLDVGIVRAMSKSFGKFFFYQLFLISKFKSHVEGYTNGTTVLHLGKGALEDFVFPLPSENLLEKFEEIAKPLWGQVQRLSLENLLLEELRDSLLPRLISGELKIPEDLMAS